MGDVALKRGRVQVWDRDVGAWERGRGLPPEQQQQQQQWAPFFFFITRPRPKRPGAES